MPARGAGLLLAALLAALFQPAEATGDRAVTDGEPTFARLKGHVAVLTRDIGERNVYFPGNLKKAETYIYESFRQIGLTPQRLPYRYEQREVANIEAEIASDSRAQRRYVLGAHYDSAPGTVGADDNASAVAVLLETARRLQAAAAEKPLGASVKFVAFALEEPPVYGSHLMGSRVYADRAAKARERIDGMICLEMVGYTCRQAGCQDYPFPLMYFGYPKTGDFIGIVGNFKSRGFARSLTRAFRKNPELPAVGLTVPFNGWILPSVRLSDHAAFWDQGFKAVMLTDSAFYRNPNYHLAADTMETLDYRFMTRLVESLLLFFRSPA